MAGIQFIIVTSAYKGNIHNDMASAYLVSMVKMIKKEFVAHNPDIDTLVEFCESRKVPDHIIVAEGLLNAYLFNSSFSLLSKQIQAEHNFNDVIIKRDPLVYIGNGIDRSKFKLVCTHLSSSSNTQVKLVCLQTELHTVDVIPECMFSRNEKSYLYDRYVAPERKDVVCLFPLFFIPLTCSPDMSFFFRHHPPAKIPSCRNERQVLLDQIPAHNIIRCGNVSMESIIAFHLSSVASWNRISISYVITVSKEGNEGWPIVSDYAKDLLDIVDKEHRIGFVRKKLPDHIKMVEISHIPEEIVNLMISEKEELVSEIKKKLHNQHHYSLLYNGDILLQYGQELVLGFDYEPARSDRDAILDILKERYDGLTLGYNRNNPYISLLRLPQKTEIYRNVCEKWYSSRTSDRHIIDFDTINFLKRTIRGNNTIWDNVLFSYKFI